jgi:ribosomal protein S18 acetylase RimI-like enzyme
MSIEIKPVRSEQTNVLKRCERIGRQSLPIFYSRTDLGKMLQGDPSFELRVAQRDEQVIGFCASARKPDRIHIMSIACLSDYRRQGVGTRLLAEVLAQRAVVSLFVQAVNASAVSFYKKNGFSTIAELEGHYSNLTDQKALLMVARPEQLANNPQEDATHS